MNFTTNKINCVIYPVRVFLVVNDFKQKMHVFYFKPYQNGKRKVLKKRLCSFSLTDWFKFRYTDTYILLNVKRIISIPDVKENALFPCLGEIFIVLSLWKINSVYQFLFFFSFVIRIKWVQCVMTWNRKKAITILLN